MKRIISTNNLLLLGVVLVGAAFLAVVTSGQFLGPVSMTSFFRFVSVPILIGLAQMVTLCVGQLNLAVGAIGGVAACLSGVMITSWGAPPWIGALSAVVTGGVLGLANGLLVIGTRINGFIITLAMSQILIGVQYGLVGTRTLSKSAWPEVAAFGRSDVFGIPTIFLLTLGVAVVVAVFFAQTVTGRRMLASGGNPVAAQLAGISIDRSLVLAHTISGLLCGVAAFVSISFLPGVNTTVGGDWLLPSFAAPIIGGVALAGGTVAVLGTVLAAMVVRLVDSASPIFRFDAAAVNFVVGAVVLGTVALGRLREVRAARRGLELRSKRAEAALAEAKR
ncbi:ABC transporter permease [Microbacterium sp. H1-D42]|uniref:ABC transporter permease n=1 Tax=Microbacterium sp. H1-D42 TaxID=2925844 RepID=UPI001F53C5AD|nr:ABC transporter permease [Microbacterium sp. H1-D42]UNK71478.1 ABC transporter permease [Microbacterium sp. H1-D42]